VRAVFGSFSGPSTISATTAISMISLMPMSNLGGRRRRGAVNAGCRVGRPDTGDGNPVAPSLLTSPSIVVPAEPSPRAPSASFAALAASSAALDAFLESLHGAAQVPGRCCAVSFVPKISRTTHQYDQPMPECSSSPCDSPFRECSVGGARNHEAQRLRPARSRGHGGA